MSDRVRALAAVARRQYGVFSLAQALEAGWSRPAVRRALEASKWEQVAPRVYRLRIGPHLEWRGELLAHTLSLRGVACDESAAALFGLLDPPRDPRVLVTSKARTHARSATRSTSCLPEVDVTSVGGIPTTTPVRTLLDLATVLPSFRFDDVLDGALLRGVVRRSRLRERAIALQAPRRPGCAVVLRALEQRGPHVERARNTWEATVLRACRAFRLPDPECNFAVAVAGSRRVLDFAWPVERVAVEFDGFEPHSGRRTFDDDRVRQNALVAQQWRVFRLTATAVRGDLRVAFGPIAAALGVDL